MKILLVFAFLTGIIVISSAQAQINLGNSSTICFATVNEAKEILTFRDDFVRSMSPFDRAARMKTDKDISEKEYLDFVGKNILEWNESEKEKVSAALQDIQALLKDYSLPFPKKMFVIKTTGDEEGRAPYTRANAIILPKNELSATVTNIRKTINHELFHILTRANPKLQENLYALIGFIKCGEAELPTELKARKITNPDAPANDHCIRLTINGKETWAIPIIFSSTEKYNTVRGGEFFNYLVFQILVVERQGKAPEVKPIYDGSKPMLVGLQQVSGFFEQVGRNTEYLIHPEEILADNFALLFSRDRNAPSPDIIKKMAEVLKSKGQTK
jgi:hypothetical protein